MSERTIEVIQDVRVKLDENKFTPEFMAEFRKYFYDFRSIDEHYKHLAQLASRGVIETPCFIEGYGDSKDMGIQIEVLR